MNTMLVIEVESVRKLQSDILFRAVMYVLCDRNLRVVPGIVITGVAGDIRSDADRTPFVILKDGRGDYGSDYDEDAERFFKTNLRTKAIRQGELFTVWWSEPDQPSRTHEATFRIKKVTPIAGQRAA
ncbi:hypothetical protein BST63_18875 [Bradyrhizobium canariense]|uniref:Uncharacterized protein n=1 Tax=Bradyrhizobium canariense TaxID=255045 RepID=A0ABX3X254_9BRAD|nr:hypothetical protein [Bradyrhizobium canariense]OSJ13747.1 hypothetical protein BSR47_19740 [Bradyrhizobium canariense]OSJ27807.1 hypothetical protein BST63_18875 [Bradyrhizobium canariense]